MYRIIASIRTGESENSNSNFITSISPSFSSSLVLPNIRQKMTAPNYLLLTGTTSVRRTNLLLYYPLGYVIDDLLGNMAPLIVFCGRRKTRTRNEKVIQI